MKIALFLDVDLTLTMRIIQEYYAKNLKCEPEYQALEAKFQSGEMKSDEFGREIIKLFAKNGLNKRKANDIAEKVRLQAYTKDLLNLDNEIDADIFLVSSGPNYYIDRLAKENRINVQNVKCSQYYFDEESGLINRCDPVDESDKAEFVKLCLKTGNYDYSIGVGDSPTLDGPFLTACSVGFLIKNVDSSYLFAPSISAVIRHARMIASLKISNLNTENKIHLSEKVSKLNTESKIHLSDMAKLGPLEVLKRFSLGSYIALLGFLAATFGIGVWFAGFKSVFGLD